MAFIFRLSAEAARRDVNFLLPHMLEAAAALAPIDLEANVEALLEIQAFTPGRVSVGVDCTDHLRRREGETNGQR